MSEKLDFSPDTGCLRAIFSSFIVLLLVFTGVHGVKVVSSVCIILSDITSVCSAVECADICDTAFRVSLTVCSGIFSVVVVAVVVVLSHVLACLDSIPSSAEGFVSGRVASSAGSESKEATLPHRLQQYFWDCEQGRSIIVSIRVSKKVS